MSAILQWTFGLCSAMAAMGLCRMLLPGSGMEKTFRFIIGVFFLCVLLSPVAIRVPNLMLELPAGTQAEIDERSRRLDEMIHRQALQTAENRLRQIIVEKLSQMGIKVHSIAINFTTSPQGEILLESVDITIDAAHRREEALINYLAAELGSSVWLYYVG